jgi:hypothetical protein
VKAAVKPRIEAFGSRRNRQENSLVAEQVNPAAKDSKKLAASIKH